MSGSQSLEVMVRGSEKLDEGAPKYFQQKTVAEVKEVYGKFEQNSFINFKKVFLNEHSILENFTKVSTINPKVKCQVKMHIFQGT